jgi:hypothetical protein
MLFKNGDRLLHIESGKKCTFKEYEVEEWTNTHPDLGYCAWVIFDRIWFRKNQERLVFIKNLQLI